jgi:phage tail-like protein
MATLLLVKTQSVSYRTLSNDDRAISQPARGRRRRHAACRIGVESIIMTNQSGAQVARWNVQRAWAVKWQGPTLNASGNDVAIETLELAHEGLTPSRDE